MSPESRKNGGRTAWIVIGSLLTIGSGLGVLAFANYKDWQAAIHEKMADMNTRGATMTPDACVEDTLEWFGSCEALTPMCLQAVPMIMSHCLAAQDRKLVCREYAAIAPREQWTFKRCQELGIDKSSAKARKKSCTAAWNAVQQFCRLDGQGVVL